MDELRCCKCGGGLAPADVSDVLIAGCPRCGGVWMDNVACGALTEGRLSADMVAFVRAWDEVQPEEGPQSAYRSASRSAGGCPVCQQPLESVAAPGVTLDICRAHGTHFDQREVNAMLFARAESAGASAAEAEKERVKLKRDVTRLMRRLRKP